MQNHLLQSYFDRIGYTGPREASLDTLRALQARHPQAIPFENLDVLNRKPISLKLEDVHRKLVENRRGGWCFEHNLLFGEALKALGFQVTPLIAKVRWGVPGDGLAPGRHMLLHVHIDGTPWLADVGFGGLTPTGPLRMDTEAPQATPHERFRVQKTPEFYLLQAEVDSGWADVYRFVLEEAPPSEFAAFNHSMATDPDALFVQNLIVSRAGEDGARLSVHNAEFVKRHRSGVDKQGIASGDHLVEVLSTWFGIAFPPGTRFGEPQGRWPG